MLQMENIRILPPNSHILCFAIDHLYCCQCLNDTCFLIESFLRVIFQNYDVKKMSSDQSYVKAIFFTIKTQNYQSNCKGVIAIIAILTFLHFVFNYVSPRRVRRHIVFPRASVCLSVRLSVCHESCPLCNLKTPEAIFTKLHTNINQH